MADDQENEEPEDMCVYKCFYCLCKVLKETNCYS